MRMGTNRMIYPQDRSVPAAPIGGGEQVQPMFRSLTTPDEPRSPVPTVYLAEW